MNLVALDVGGANLKWADGLGRAVSVPFPLWKNPQGLPNALAEMLAGVTAPHWAVTMTGELADCYRTKREGVNHILDAVEHAAAGRTVSVYLTDGRLVEPSLARQNPLLAAASNWHALAAWAGRFAASGQALLIDMGSTTTDIIPLKQGQVAASGRTDPERMLHRELIYTGVFRSPVCAVCRELPWRSAMVGVAQELFATTGDVYLMLGDLPSEEECSLTADGRPFTKEFATDRLSRMICADSELFSEQDALQAARSIADEQLQQVWRGVQEVVKRCGEPEIVLTSGQGEFLIRRVCDRLGYAGRLYSLAEHLGPEVSACAPAHALAVLAHERWNEA